MVILLIIMMLRGLTYVISESLIFLKYREKIKPTFLLNLINCPICASFWIAAIFWLLISFNILTAVFFGLIQITFTKITTQTF